VKNLRQSIAKVLLFHLTSALNGDAWSTARPGSFAIGERDPVAGWVGPKAGLDPYGKSCQLGFDTRTAQQVASSYTDWDTPARNTVILYVKMSSVQWLVSSISTKIVGPVTNRTASKSPSSLQRLLVHLMDHYQGADKSLARPTSRCVLFDGENISFDATLVICIKSTNISPIMIINRIYETQNLLSL
jgi:hypothetical protein